ncbi:MAG TPA: GatB/YqeY domain-containing protein [Acidobacteriaceae bacterium]
MTLQERIQQDTIAAMKERAQLKLDVLRMVKTAIKNKEIEKRAPLGEPEVLQTLTTLIKQRRDSVEAFTKGNRPELAEKEAAEIKIIETYMPQQADESKIRSLVEATLAEMSSAGKRPTPKDMGLIIKDVQTKIAATGLRADGKRLSEIVKAELAKS